MARTPSFHLARSSDASQTPRHPPVPPLRKGGKIESLDIPFPPLAKGGARPPKGWGRWVGSGAVFFRGGLRVYATRAKVVLGIERTTAVIPCVLVVAAAAVGLALLWGGLGESSATYDEVAYLRIAARWWRTGEQSQITRMGSPLLFWKLQQAPMLWILDQVGRRDLIDDPLGHQQELLPIIRAGALWIWLVAFVLVAAWSRLLYGPRAMALSAWLFVLSPNVLAHSGLVTMELPVMAATTGMVFLFWAFLTSGRWWWFWASAALGGLAFSCKYTTVLIPPILAVAWWLYQFRQRGSSGARLGQMTTRVALGMSGYVLVFLLANIVVTGFAFMPLSQSKGDHPSIAAELGDRFTPWIARIYETSLPQDWVGFATQTHHQMSGGPSYLMGERGLHGWRHYYLVALAVKVPLTFWLLLAGRIALAARGERDVSRADRDQILPLTIGLFLTIAALGSTRNYGLRYLLPLAPLAIIWVSRLAEKPEGSTQPAFGWQAWIVMIGLTGQAIAVASVYPHELTYFNALGGGPRGGRHLLSDSNLDWGQGLKGLAHLQRLEPNYRDMTLYYFGDTDPAHYGVLGTAYVVNAVDDQSRLPELGAVSTRYLAVSASLQWGPWGPPGFFRDLNNVEPVRFAEDTTIAVYRTADVRRRGLGPNSDLSRQ